MTTFSEAIPIVLPRLLLDRFRPEDWDDYYSIENSPEQHRFNRETFAPMGADQTKQYVAELSQQTFDELRLPIRLAIRLADGQRLIGFIGFKTGNLEPDGETEVFYSINHGYWSQGYGTEAVAGMIRFGFELIGLHRIFAGCDIDNVASKRVLEKTGMRFESRWRKDRMRNGKWTDGLGFAILEEDLQGPAQ